jgi:NAD(P)-dependent dehydrogenase (short-subunit alcohol dehydrogenase family)
MATVLVTGSTAGLGLAAAREMLGNGHRVIVHARDDERAVSVQTLLDDGAQIVIADLADLEATRKMAESVNSLGDVDAVIPNAGIYVDAERSLTVDGHPRVVAVNVIAPYVLTALINRPARLVYLSSGMHTSGRVDLDDLDWNRRTWDGVQAYCDSKLLVSTLAAAIARRCPDTLTNAVDPGWVPTRMGGSHATDDLALGHDTQVWLATSNEQAALATGKYWYHRTVRTPAAAVNDPKFQDQLLETLERITDVRLSRD